MTDLTDEDRARIRDVFTDHGYAGDPVLAVDAAIYRAGLAAGRARTIEECAKVCEDAKPRMYRQIPRNMKLGYDEACNECAAAIRALTLAQRTPAP